MNNTNIFQKYKKLPVTVEAFQLTKNVSINDLLKAVPEIDDINISKKTVRIRTLEGIMVAREGDWIIRGVEREVYSCKDSIFKKTYKEIDFNENDTVDLNETND